MSGVIGVEERRAPRTKLQAAADEADCDVFNLICKLERLYDANRKNDRAQEAIHRALENLRSARPHLRSLMSNEDRART